MFWKQAVGWKEMPKNEEQLIDNCWWSFCLELDFRELEVMTSNAVYGFEGKKKKKRICWKKSNVEVRKKGKS